MKHHLQIEFEVYHDVNPHIYELVKRFADEIIAAGHKKFGLSAIWERIRWERLIESKDLNFKLPNNHRAYYARMWLNDHPEHPKFFRICQLRSVNPGRRDRYGRDLGATP
jgi:hypothetical protein